MRRYNPKDIEPKWQKIWEDQKIYQASEDPAKPKRYVLEYFPYPSGAAMHVGHVRNYTIGDAVARFYRMRGYNVMHPMGWDAFGLPAENYAIKNNISPQQAIAQNTAKFKQQLMQMGFSYDWSREINSSDPGYYKWTQWFFKLLFDRGLAYQKESPQWWCETDKTVLANEQVEAGKCWRCGNEVTKKSLKQWFFKITDYADRLVEDLEDLDWSEAIKSMQRNWVGRSKGAEITFRVDSQQSTVNSPEIKVFTTRADTLFGATFMVLAPEHPLVNQLTTDSQQSAVKKYQAEGQKKSEIERQETDRAKTGVFTGAYAINPVNNEKIPIWIADYVLMGYGTGAIMAVPAHDERDFEFAKKFDLPIVDVIRPYIELAGINAPRNETETHNRDVVDMIIKNAKGEYLLLVEKDNVHFVGGGIEDDDINILEAVKRETTEETGYIDFKDIQEVGSGCFSYGYRITKSKNQYCNCRFFEVFLASDHRVDSEIEKGLHKIKWVKKSDVANMLTWEHHLIMWNQYLTQERFHGEGVLTNSGAYDGMSSAEMRDKIVADLEKQGAGKEVVNYKIRDWLISRQRYWGAPIPIIHCPKDGAVAVPDDQLPVELPVVKSYQPTGEGASVLAGAPDWVNTTCPKCGGPAKRETDTMDGFACSSWYFLRFADPHNDKAAFSPEKAKFWLPVDDYIGGAEHAVMHLLYARMWTKVMFDAGLVEFNEPFTALRNQGMILAPDGRKMSKSWGNVIAPDDLISQGYGADCVRIMELFIGPWDQSANWSVEGMGGAFRFLQRIWTLIHEYLDAENDQKNGDSELQRIAHKTIATVSGDLHKMGFNTAIATLMEAVNQLYKIKAEKGFVYSQDWHFVLSTLTQLLAPIAPHVTEELWQSLDHEGSVHISTWPVHDEKYLLSDTMIIVIQINGKLRSQLEVPADSTESAVVEVAKADPKITSYLAGKDIKKSIYVAGKLVNFVI